eukprot:scaffold2394_cov276-Pinguiococcus_pyrenoidosus.AAC.4
MQRVEGTAIWQCTFANEKIDDLEIFGGAGHRKRSQPVDRHLRNVGTIPDALFNGLRISEAASDVQAAEL